MNKLVEIIALDPEEEESEFNQPRNGYLRHIGVESYVNEEYNMIESRIMAVVCVIPSGKYITVPVETLTELNVLK